MALKVAILGLSQSSRHLAPWGNPEWELWGLAWDHDRFKYARTFEMHEMRELKQYQTKGYLKDLYHCPALHMHDAYPEVEGSIRYPFEAVAESVGDYWNSSIGYAMALAIHEGAQEIGLYGIDMKQDPPCFINFQFFVKLFDYLSDLIY